MLNDDDARLYLIVVTTVRLVPPAQVVDAIPLTTLAGLGHTRKSASERLRDAEFWRAAPLRAASIVGDTTSHERYAVGRADSDASVLHRRRLRRTPDCRGGGVHRIFTDGRRHARLIALRSGKRGIVKMRQ